MVALFVRDFDGPDLDYQLLLYPVTSADDDWASYAENGEGYVLDRAEMAAFTDHYFDAGSKRTTTRSRWRRAIARTSRRRRSSPAGSTRYATRSAYADALSGAGVSVTRRHYPDPVHGVANVPGDPGVAAARDLFADAAADLRAGVGG